MRENIFTHLGILIQVKWRNGKKHGEGTYTYAFGGKYIGSWVDDKKHGKGSSIDAQGNSYEGNYAHGEMEGEGIYII